MDPIDPELVRFFNRLTKGIEHQPAMIQAWARRWAKMTSTIRNKK